MTKMHYGQKHIPPSQPRENGVCMSGCKSDQKDAKTNKYIRSNQNVVHPFSIGSYDPYSKGMYSRSAIPNSKNGNRNTSSMKPMGHN
ncbi:MAG: hypothetical protein ACK559_33935, partial [bacterium]